MTQLPVLILAGGLGTRLGEKTRNTPKALVPIAGQPFLFWKLSQLVQQGVREVHILAGYLGHELRDYAGTVDLPLSIRVHEDGKDQLGTAGATFRALQEIDCKHFVLTYGDNLLPQELSGFTINPRSFPLLVTTKNIRPRDKANIKVVDGLVVEYSKSLGELESMDYGYAVFEKENFLGFEGNSKGDLGKYFQHLAHLGKLHSFETNKNYFEMGTPESFVETESWLLSNSTK